VSLFSRDHHSLPLIPNVSLTVTCPNAGRASLTHGHAEMNTWINTYLEDATQRLQKEMKGIEIAPRDVFHVSLLQSSCVLAFPLTPDSLR